MERKRRFQSRLRLRPRKQAERCVCCTIQRNTFSQFETFRLASSFLLGEFTDFYNQLGLIVFRARPTKVNFCSSDTAVSSQKSRSSYPFGLRSDSRWLMNSASRCSRLLLNGSVEIVNCRVKTFQSFPFSVGLDRVGGHHSHICQRKTVRLWMQQKMSLISTRKISRNWVPMQFAHKPDSFHTSGLNSLPIMNPFGSDPSRHPLAKNLQQ